MSELRLLASNRPDGTGAPLCCLAEDEAGARWGLFAETEAEVSAAPRDPGRCVAVPGTLSNQDALTVLAHWPAWRLTALADLELGSRILVIGAGWLARTALLVCGLRGCEWRATHGLTATEAEHVLESQMVLREALQRRHLPQPPDAVIHAENPTASIEGAAGICRTGGTVVIAGRAGTVIDFGFYPDAHRRGLRLYFADPTRWQPRGRVDEEDIRRLARKLAPADPSVA